MARKKKNYTKIVDTGLSELLEGVTYDFVSGEIVKFPDTFYRKIQEKLDEAKRKIESLPEADECEVVTGVSYMDDDF